MTHQRTVLASRKGLCCLYLLALSISLLSWPVWAQEAPSSAIGGQPTAVQPGTVLQSPGTVPGPAGTILAGPQDPSKQTIIFGPPGSQFPWLSGPCPGPFWSCANPDGCLDPSGIAASFGWWGVQRSGSPWVIGQWQSTTSSPFWDVDGLWTNGTRTLNYTATGADNEDTKARVQYYGQNSQGFIDFNRFIHAEEHEGFDNMNASAVIPGKGPGSGEPVIAQDLNKGENYAIRVNQYEAQYKYNLVGQPGKDDFWIKAGINVWDQQEFGDVQANNTVHCFLAKAMSGQQQSCHVLSQAQSIDWNTFEVTPTLEARIGRVNIQYSHTLRVFSANDQTVIGTYDDGGANILKGNYPYDVVPESLFNMDKIKIGIDVNDHNRIYAYGYFSEVENSEAGVSREQGGIDFRWTNTAIKGLNLTTYFKNDDQSGNKPTQLLTPDQTQGLTPAEQAAELYQLPNQIGFNRYTMGEKFSWRPWTGDCDAFLSRLCVTGGYEFDYLIRTNENWYEPSLSALPPGYNVSSTTGILYQPNTVTNSLNIGVQVPWTENIHTYLRYKVKFIKDALVGYTPDNYAVNSCLPDTENIIEFGGDWFPSLKFGASFNQSFDLAARLGGPLPIAGNPIIVGTGPGDTLNFGEDSYSTSVVFWYRPTDKLTLSANSDYFANQIKQNINIGDDTSTSTSGAGSSFVSYAPYSSPWTYGGTAVEFGGSVNYQINRTLKFSADYEVTFGKDLITSGGLQYSSGTPITNTFIPLGSYSTVRNVMQQVKVGFDYKPRPRMTMYLRYQYVGFEDKTDSTNSGNMNMVMAGFNYKW